MSNGGQFMGTMQRTARKLTVFNGIRQKSESKTAAFDPLRR
jgi:hypothetical protein